MKANIDNENEQRELDNVITEVKEQLQRMFTEKKILIKELGEAYEKVVSKQESICEEIKNVLKNEITEGLISKRLIEIYCPDKWKKKTKPKNKNQNEKFSLSEEKKSLTPMMMDTDGKVISGAQDYNDTDVNISDTDDKYEEVEMDDIPKSDIKNLDRDKGDCLEFEISIRTKVIRKYTAYELDKHEGANNILIHGKIDRTTSRVISAWVGRNSEQMQHRG